jgi:predicted phage terminase large subunit-like protein
MIYPSRERVQGELARRSLADFVKMFWPIVEPTTRLCWNWHIDAICEHLQAVSEGHIRKLLINIPPGHMKSLLVSVMWPAWTWANKPGWRALFGSYAERLALRDSGKCRDIIASDLYQRVYCKPDGWALDKQGEHLFTNTAMGSRLALGVGGPGTGFRGDCRVVDDPLKALEAPSEVKREEAIRWWDQTMSTRLNDMRTGASVVVMQRLHEDDLSGHLIKQGGYEHLCLMSEFDPKRRASTCKGLWQDPRTERGELLFPEMFPKEVLDDLKIQLASDGYAGQHDQLPVSAEGGMFKKHWWRRYEKAPANFHEVAGSLDCTFKDTKSADFVTLGVWGRLGANKYLLKQYRGRMDFVATCALVKRAFAEHPDMAYLLIEDKANGPAVLSALRDTVPSMIAVNPIGSKEARAQACTPTVEAGNVWLPQSGAGWESDQKGDPVDQFISECAAFPKGRNDDQVDQLSQMLARWRPTATAMKVHVPRTRPKETGVYT